MNKYTTVQKLVSILKAFEKSLMIIKAAFLDQNLLNIVKYYYNLN